MSNFSYRVMRIIARFGIVRSLYNLGLKRPSPIVDDYHRVDDPFSVGSDHLAFHLERDGYSEGLSLKPEFVKDVRDYADNNICYANRDPSLGFMVKNRQDASQQISESIIVAQYFNFSATSVAKKIVGSPTIQKVVGEYFGVTPKLVGVNLWWTFPGEHSEEQQKKHAHFFHRDIDDFKFLKLFIYLNDVGAGDGPHVLVRGSHKKKFTTQITDIWRERRYRDAEVKEKFGGDILTIYGEAGKSFFENTLCLHKGETPQKKPRLLLQFEWALNDYGVANDKRSNLSLLK